MTSPPDPDAPVTGRAVHPIEAQSYAILRSRIDLDDRPPLVRAVTERVVHASADLDYAADLVCDEEALRRGWRALRDGAPIVADVAMVASGVTARRAAGEVICRVGDPGAAELARTEGVTRSAAAVRLAAAEVGPDAVWVIGCAPTALYAVIAADIDPALVVGLPVGFVGAAESKAALRASGLPAVSNRGEKGGSAVAVAAVNALLYTAMTTEPPPARRSARGDAPAEALEETGRNT
jgi:precorrin-8X/cobalt-precorrin-8 methylmutase